MKRHFIISLLCIVGAALFNSCSSDDDDSPAAKVPAEATGTWTDSRDGQQYRWVRYAGLDWMAENFRYDLNDEGYATLYLDAYDYDYNKTSQKCLPKYGRLYTYQGALKACPEGWRLPTDQDWQRLEVALGMSAGEAAAKEWRGNIAPAMLTTLNDSTDLSLRLGGFYITSTNMGRSGYRFLGVYAFYWTATQDADKEGNYYLYRKLLYNSNAVYRQSMEESANMLSVRYVRDAQ